MATTRNPFTGNAQDERFVIQTSPFLSVDWADFPGLTERTRYGTSDLAEAVTEVMEMVEQYDNAQFRIIRRTEEMVMNPILSRNVGESQASDAGYTATCLVCDKPIKDGNVCDEHKMSSKS